MAENIEKRTEAGTCDETKNESNIIVQIEGSPLPSQQPSRARLSLPLRSTTLNQTSTEAFAEFQSQQLIQSSSFEGATGYAAASTTVALNIDSAAFSTASGTNSNENEVLIKSDELQTRINFKTKRFYESETDCSLIQTLFSQTIRSTASTPAEEVEIVTILERCGLKESETVTEINIPEADNSVKPPATSAITPTTTPLPSNNETDTIDAPTTDIENLSAADDSNAESQTDNLDMYNEPNMASIIDNVNCEHEDYIKDIDEDVISERVLPIIRPLHQPATGAPIRRPSIIVELYTDSAVKPEECKIDGECGYVSPPLWKTVLQPTLPTSGVSYFDMTIEEDVEEEEITYDADKGHKQIGADLPANNTSTFGTDDNKSTNTELIFDSTTNICPIKEAAGPNPSTDGKRTDIEKIYECDNNKPTEEDDEQSNDKPSCSNIKRTNTNDFVYQIEEEKEEEEENDKESVVEDYNEDEFGIDLEITDPSEDDDDSEDEFGAICNFMTMDSEATKTTVVSKTKKNVSKRSVTTTSSLMTSADVVSSTPAMITTTVLEKNALDKLKSPKKGHGVMAATSTAAATTSVIETIDEIQMATTSSTAIRSDDGVSLEMIEKRTNSKSSSTSGKNKTRKSRKSESAKETAMKKIYLTEKLATNWKSKDHHARTIEINRDVSVKHLRDSYCNLVGIGSDCNINRADYSSKKSSFSKFDALQKKNILHVRSSDSGKAQEKFGDKVENEQNCRACNKVVYKMEEMKAEKNIWHRNCFKCIECGKLLNVDTYQSHESVLYCKPHFKLLFAPKAVEDNEPAKPRKPELIIRENQPEELPPDVVRASDKPDLGLEELHQLNVKSRFQVFENYQEQSEQQANSIERSPSGVKRSASILSKLAKFQAKGLHTGVSDDALNGITYEQSSSEEEEEEDNIPEGEDADLIRAKRAQRERPMSFSNMNDIKTKFESGHVMTKEERREERKQEIQNIRSRLFMGKQARIKEMYQQAVADSEQGITSSSKKPEIEIGDKARSLKEKFEKGEITNREDNEDEDVHSKVQEEDVFEQGISKKSRSIFMELDASASKSPQSPMPGTPRTPDIKKLSQVSPLQVDKLKPFPTENVVKCDEKQDDIKIETSEISSKFKFFESYKPSENKKKEFRITPPREGVVKMPSPDREVYVDPTVVRSEEKIDDPTVAEQTHTATKVLSMFRQMEQQKYDHSSESGPKPLKRFTPPPDDNRRVLEANDSEDGVSASDDEEYEGEEEEEQEESEEEKPAYRYEDEILKQAQAAARAKQLRAKFEKWEANEIQRELSNGTINIYEKTDENDESQIESAKSLRAKFESMREVTNKNSTRPRVQVNRFV